MAVNIKNKKASYTYFLTDEFTAGLVLSGSEIKSIRAGKASITEDIAGLTLASCGCTTCTWRNTPTPDTCPRTRSESVNFCFKERSLKSWKRR